MLEDLPSDCGDTDVEEDSDDEASDLREHSKSDPLSRAQEERFIVYIGGNEPEFDAEDPDEDQRPSAPKDDKAPDADNKTSERRTWRRKSEAMQGRVFRSARVEGVDTIATPVDAFHIFFYTKIFDKLLHETNLYRTQKENLGNISLGEMYVFLGINIIMGYHRLPSLPYYWMTGDDTGVCAVKRAMARDRFLYILSNLHVNDNAKLDKKDKIYKVRALVEALNDRFTDKRAPRQHLSIDESVICFQGRSSLQQYNPRQAVQRGYKMWCLGDKEGYIYKFEVYTGKKGKKEGPGIQKLTLGGNTVLTMTDHLCGKKS